MPHASPVTSRTDSPPPSKRPRRSSILALQQHQQQQQPPEMYAATTRDQVHYDPPTAGQHIYRRGSSPSLVGGGPRDGGGDVEFESERRVSRRPRSPSIRGAGRPQEGRSPTSGLHLAYKTQTQQQPPPSSSSSATFYYESARPQPLPPSPSPPPAAPAAPAYPPRTVLIQERTDEQSQYKPFPALQQPYSNHHQRQHTPQRGTMNGNPTASSSSASMQHRHHQHSSTSSDPGQLPPLSLSILGVEPFDEFIKQIADFIHHMISSRPEHLVGAVEVEAKVGILRDTHSGRRIDLPVLVESILRPEMPEVRFESNMSAHQHKHYNQLLNNLKTSPNTSPSPIDYSHLYLVDSFYQASDATGSDKRLRGSDKIRVTRNEKTGEVIQCVKKIRLGDLNIFSPKRQADWRVSVNIEVPVSHPLGSPTHTRRKDRLCYEHEEFIIDLTQVFSQTAPGAPQQVLHELELEIARPDLLLSTAAKRNDVNYSEHERSAFDELIRAFVNNARILVRNSIGFD